MAFSAMGLQRSAAAPRCQSQSPHQRRSLPHDDTRNPINFSELRKWHIVAAGMLTVFNGNLGSSLPSGAVPAISRAFAVQSHSQLVLLNSLYLVGYAIGPLLFGPMSEFFGRKPVVTTTYIGCAFFTMCCALAPNFPALLAFRLLAGVYGAAPNAVAGGLYADIFDNPRLRGRAMAFFLYVGAVGPLLGPMVSGFVSTRSWRWTFWTGAIIAAAGLPVVVTIPETYVPILLEQLERKEQPGGGDGAVARLRKKAPVLVYELASHLRRPFNMIVSEPVLFLSSLYLSLVYGLFYLNFQAYPIIFQGIYGMSPGVAGLAFIPAIFGATSALLFFLWYASHFAKCLDKGVAWTKVEEYRRLPLACLGGPALAIALFWLGWTSTPNTSPILPMMSGILFGFGYISIFFALINYITDFFETASASAQAAASTTRSLAAFGLPLAVRPMYDDLGVNWASSLLGFLALLMAAIPFTFIYWRHKIRKQEGSQEGQSSRRWR